MRKIVWYVCFSAFIICVSSYPQEDSTQQKERPATKLETVLVTKGSLIIRETYELGGFEWGKVKFDAIILYEQGKEDIKTKGIRITITDPKVESIKHTMFLDLEEMISLKKSVDYMIEMAPKLKAENKEVDIIYSSKDNFIVDLITAPGIQSLYILKGPFMNNSYEFDIKMLSSISFFMEKGFEILR
jgi:hypothetical protein